MIGLCSENIIQWLQLMPYILKEHVIKSKDITQAYILKHILKRENEVILSMISHYHTVKSLSPLMKSIKSSVKQNHG